MRKYVGRGRVRVADGGKEKIRKLGYGWPSLGQGEKHLSLGLSHKHHGKENVNNEQASSPVFSFIYFQYIRPYTIVQATANRPIMSVAHFYRAPKGSESNLKN